MSTTAQSKESSVSDLAARFGEVRALTEQLCAPLEIEDFIPQPYQSASPPKWNIAHTTWFFEEMILKKFVPGYEVFNPDFGFLFNSYYNSIGSRTSQQNRGDLSRPTVKEVFAYRRHVDGKMKTLLAAEISEDLRALLVLGLNHEQQHQELFLTDIKYTFSVNPLLPVYQKDFVPCERRENQEKARSGSVEFEAGIYEIGYDGGEFCFDNELGRHKVYLDDFSISRNLVTNEEFIEFIDDGGYTDFRFWHSDGWTWVNNNQISCPLYWKKKDGEWVNFTLGGLRLVKPEAPVCHLSLYEAAAYAEWKKMRLPTEFEWEAASRFFDWGLRWEWTNSAYLPYPNFKKAAGAVGEYNGKFMINQMVLRGASVATPAGHSRLTYRNFFHPETRWQFSGLRLAK